MAAIALVTIAVGTVTPFAVRPMLRRSGVLDVPSARSSHTVPVLRGGGVATAIAIAAGALTAVLLSGGSSVTGDYLSVVVVAAVGLAAAVLGIAEDVRHLPIRLRLLGQVVIGLVPGTALSMIFGTNLWFVVLAGAVLFPVVVNATNFMDGVDDLTSFSQAVIGLYFAVLGRVEGLGALSTIGVLIAAAAVSFLPWNNGPHKMFLGDCGSYLFGGLLASAVLVALVEGAGVVEVAVVLAVQLSDTGATLILRSIRRADLSQSHREHRYHRLEDLGFGHITVAGIVAAAVAFCCLLGLLFAVTGSPWAVVGVVLVCAVYSLAPNVLRRRPREEEGL